MSIVLLPLICCKPTGVRESVHNLVCSYGTIQLCVRLVQTMLGRAGGLTVLQSKGDRYSVLQGDKLRFGSLETTISYGATFHQVSARSPASVGVRIWQTLSICITLGGKRLVCPTAACHNAYMHICVPKCKTDVTPACNFTLCTNRSCAVGQHNWKCPGRLRERQQPPSNRGSATCLSITNA